MLLKLIVVAAAIFLVVKLLKGDRVKKGEQAKKERDRKIASGEMVKDPICGVYVDKDNDIRVREGEKIHTFCSYECRDKFIKQLEAVDVDKAE